MGAGHVNVEPLDIEMPAGRDLVSLRASDFPPKHECNGIYIYPIEVKFLPLRARGDTGIYRKSSEWVSTKRAYYRKVSWVLTENVKVSMPAHQRSE